MNRIIARFTHRHSKIFIPTNKVCKDIIPYLPIIVINKCVKKQLVNNVNIPDCRPSCPYNNPPATFYKPSKEMLDSPYFTHLYKNHNHVYAALELYSIHPLEWD